LTNINPNEDVLYIEEDNPYPTRFYTEEEEAQNIKDEQRMARVDMEGLAYERSYRHEDYDDVAGMFADGADIDDIPESFCTKTMRRKTTPKPLAEIETKRPREEDIEYIPF
jgi:hypothetical protein